MKANLQGLLSINRIGIKIPFIVLLVVNCAGFANYGAEIQYTITDLGTLGGTLIYASGLNNNGQVVGNCNTTNGARRAFLYANGHLTDLGTLGGTNSYAYAINNSGQIVGGAETSSGIEDAFLFTNAVMSDLGTFGGTASDARAINNQGQIAGGFWTIGETAYHAYLYSSSAGTMTDLGTLGGTRTLAYGLNDNGQVVGQSSISGLNPSHAFLYSGGSMTDLGTLGGSQSFAYAINNSGQIVGAAFTFTNVEHAFLYSGGTMTDLDSAGSLQSRAYAINRFGEVAGFISGPGTGDRAFVYSGGTMTDLNTVIDTNQGWTLEVAAAINDRGQIAGIGTHPAGTLRAFLLTPVPNLQISLTPSNANAIQLQFIGHAGEGYVVEYRASLDSGSWQILYLLDPVPATQTITLTDALTPDRPTRFYRVRTR